MSIFVGLFSLGSQYRFFTSEPTARIFPTKSCPKILIVFFSCESESCTTSRNALRYQIPRSDPQKPAYRTLRMTDVASPGLLRSSRNGAGTSRRKKPLEFSHPSFFMSSVSALIFLLHSLATVEINVFRTPSAVQITFPHSLNSRI